MSDSQQPGLGRIPTPPDQVPFDKGPIGASPQQDAGTSRPKSAETPNRGRRKIIAGVGILAVLLAGAGTTAYLLTKPDRAPKVSAEALGAALPSDCTENEGDWSGGAELIEKAETFGVSQFVDTISDTVDASFWCSGSDTSYFVTTGAAEARELADSADDALPITSEWGDVLEAVSERTTLESGAEGRVLSFTWTGTQSPDYFMSVGRYGNVYAVGFTYANGEETEVPNIAPLLTGLVAAVDTANSTDAAPKQSPLNAPAETDETEPDETPSEEISLEQIAPPNATPGHGIALGAQPDTSIPHVTIYTDFQSPAGASQWAEYGPAYEELVDTGAITLEFRYATFLDANAQNDSSTKAVHAVSAADAVGKFADMHRVIFASQREGGGGFTQDEFRVAFPAAAGITGDDLETYLRLFDGGAFNDFATATSSTFEASGLNSVPQSLVGEHPIQFYDNGTVLVQPSAEDLNRAILEIWNAGDAGTTGSTDAAQPADSSASLVTIPLMDELGHRSQLVIDSWGEVYDFNPDECSGFSLGLFDDPAVSWRFYRLTGWVDFLEVEGFAWPNKLLVQASLDDAPGGDVMGLVCLGSDQVRNDLANTQLDPANGAQAQFSVVYAYYSQVSPAYPNGRFDEVEALDQRIVVATSQGSTSTLCEAVDAPEGMTVFAGDTSCGVLNRIEP